jgi:hypothetical protein
MKMMMKKEMLVSVFGICTAVSVCKLKQRACDRQFDYNRLKQGIRILSVLHQQKQLLVHHVLVHKSPDICHQHQLLNWGSRIDSFLPNMLMRMMMSLKPGIRKDLPHLFHTTMTAACSSWAFGMLVAVSGMRLNADSRIRTAMILLLLLMRRCDAFALGDRVILLMLMLMHEVDNGMDSGNRMIEHPHRIQSCTTGTQV